MVTPARLITSADEIDNRLGPIPGRSSDRIAVELRAAAKIIATIPDTLADLTPSMLRAGLERYYELGGLDGKMRCSPADLMQEIYTAIERARLQRSAS